MVTCAFGGAKMSYKRLWWGSGYMYVTNVISGTIMSYMVFVFFYW
jgi:hypothetical protein